ILNKTSVEGIYTVYRDWAAPSRARLWKIKTRLRKALFFFNLTWSPDCQRPPPVPLAVVPASVKMADRIGVFRTEPRVEQMDALVRHGVHDRKMAAPLDNVIVGDHDRVAVFPPATHLPDARVAAGLVLKTVLLREADQVRVRRACLFGGS